MDDSPNPDPANSQPPSQSNSPTPVQGQPTSSPNAPDVTKMAEELGRLKTENQALKNYQIQVDPFIRTVWSDNVDKETRDKLTAAHNKRLGITPDDTNISDIPPAPSPEITKVENKVNEIRNSEVAEKINGFYQRHSIDKLEEEAKKDINVRVGSVLLEMLDPMGNKKDLKQALEDVPLNKLDKFLEDAYYLVTKDTQLEQARQEGAKIASDQNRGIIGSMPSASANSDEVNLTSVEKKVAAHMGISEDKFLARKKEIASRGGVIY